MQQLILGFIFFTSISTALASFSGHISHESIVEPEQDKPWAHGRTRLSLRQKSEDTLLQQTGAFWSHEASGFLQYDSAGDHDERREARIENLLLRIYRGPWSLRVGWQTISWGETLGPSLVDLINPRDLRDPSYWLKADRKLAVPLLLVGFSHESATIEAWFNPTAPQSLLPDSWQGFSIDSYGQTQSPEFGVRAGDLYAGWDFKVYALHHRARIPALTLRQTAFDPAIQASFPVQNSYGITVSQAWEALVLRSEIVHAEIKNQPSGNLLPAARNQATLGLDSSVGEHFFWGSELRYSQQKTAVDQDQNLGWVIVQGRWSLWDDRLKPLIHLMQRMAVHDAYQRYEVMGNIEHGWEVGLVWEAFQSATAGYFSQLRAYDRLGLNVLWEF